MVGIRIDEVSDEFAGKMLEEAGIKFNPEKYANIQKCFEDMKWKLFDSSEFSLHEGEEDGVEGTVLGKTLAEWSDDDCSDSEFSMAEIEAIGAKIKSKYGIDSEPKIYFGTRMC